MILQTTANDIVKTSTRTCKSPVYHHSVAHHSFRIKCKYLENFQSDLVPAYLSGSIFYLKSYHSHWLSIVLQMSQDTSNFGTVSLLFMVYERLFRWLAYFCHWDRILHVSRFVRDFLTTQSQTKPLPLSLSYYLIYFLPVFLHSKINVVVVVTVFMFVF